MSSPGTDGGPGAEGVVVFYQDRGQPGGHAWRWKLVGNNGEVVSSSDQCFRTRRGAVDDWNQIQRVVQRYLHRSTRYTKSAQLEGEQ